MDDESGMSAGYYKRRRGVIEHIENGTIDLLENGIHDYLNLKANLVIGSPCSIPVGVCFTSAPALHAYCCRVSERTLQRILEHMEAIGWLKTFKTAGKRGNYPTLLCRASVHDLSGNEYRINGAKTTDWHHPVYEPVGEVSGSCPETGGTLSGDREVRSEKGELRKKKEAAGQPARDLELWNLINVRPEKMPGPFRELCEQLYANKNGQPLSEFVGVCMDGWEALGGKRQPREFVQAATRIREQEKNPPAPPIKFLPELPFQTKKAWPCQPKN
jgi:hypothetical protein